MVRESRRQRARRLGRISFDVLREDRRLLVFPAMSVVVSLLLGGSRSPSRSTGLVVTAG